MLSAMYEHFTHNFWAIVALYDIGANEVIVTLNSIVPRANKPFPWSK